MKTVLIVEDDQDICFIIQCALELCGYNVCTAGDGLQAQKNVTQNLPDMIVLDMIMPVMDGITFNSWLKQNPVTQPIPVIAISGNRQLSDIFVKYKDVKLTDLLEKPFPVRTLVDKINSILQPERIIDEQTAEYGNTPDLTKTSD